MRKKCVYNKYHHDIYYYCVVILDVHYCKHLIILDKSAFDPSNGICLPTYMRSQMFVSHLDMLTKFLFIFSIFIEF